ncbi:MAG: N-6 DNA methylase [Promethearchaeota archaeon]
MILEYGISSKLFQQFKKSYHTSPLFVKSYHAWLIITSKDSLPGSSLSDQPMEDYYFQQSYGMWVIHNIQRKTSDELSCPPEIWKGFSWLDEIKDESHFFPVNESLFPAEDLFGDLLGNLSHYLHREEHGMFYTPLSLTQLLISNTFENPETSSIQGDILDPTCGTGSFLITLFNNILGNLETSHPRDKLPPQLLRIFGFDQNPLAVYATLVNLQNIVINHHQFSASSAQSLAPQFHCLDLFTLFSIEENHRFFNAFDCILGNLPWNVLNNIQDTEVKAYLEQMGKHFDLFMTWKNRSNLEIATVLFEIIRTRLLQPTGKLCLLLPASLLTASQHATFRRLTGLQNIRTFHFTPDPFPIHAIGLYAEKKKESQPVTTSEKKTITAFKYRLLRHSEPSYQLLTKEVLEPAYVSVHRNKPLIGKFIPQNTDPDLLPIQKSFYAPQVYRGVDITPRNLLFVQSSPDPQNVPHSPVLVTIRPITQQYTSTQSKTWNFTPYDSALIEKSALRFTVKSSDLLPFLQVAKHPTFLPFIVEGDQNYYTIPDLNRLPPYTRKHFKHLQHIFSEHQKPAAKNQTLNASLEYGKKLHNPALLSPLKIIYPVGGSYSKAALIRDHTLMIDVTFYYLTPSSEDEAYYLLAWLNSSLLHRNLYRVCTVGANGSIRAIHLGPWKFPLPEFNASDLTHQKIIRLSQNLEKTIHSVYLQEKIVATLSTDPFTRKIALKRAYAVIQKTLLVQTLKKKIDALFLPLLQPRSSSP